MSSGVEIKPNRKAVALRVGLYLLAAFLLARLALVEIAVRWPMRPVLIDSEQYLSLADSLLNGDYSSEKFPDADLIRPPGYPGFVAVIWKLSGENIPAIVFTQLALGGLACLLLYCLGLQLGNPTAGLAAAWFLALSPNVTLWSLMIMAEVPFMLLLLSASILWLKGMKGRKKWPLIAAGAVLGLAVLFRPIGLYLIPIWLAIGLFTGGRREAGLALARGGLFLAGAALLLLPWAVRNWQVHDRLTLPPVSERTLRGFNLAYAVADAEGIDCNQAVSTMAEQGSFGDQFAWVMKNYPAALLKVKLLGVARTLRGVEVGSWAWLIEGPQGTAPGILTALTSGNWNGLRVGIRELLETSDRAYLLILLLLSLTHSGLLLGLAAAGSRRRLWPQGRATLWLSLALASRKPLVDGVVMPHSFGMYR